MMYLNYRGFVSKYNDNMPLSFYNGAIEAWNYQQQKIDELQKRIDSAVEHIEDYYGVVGLSIIVDILKGDQS